MAGGTARAALLHERWLHRGAAVGGCPEEDWSEGWRQACERPWSQRRSRSLRRGRLKRATSSLSPAWPLAPVSTRRRSAACAPSRPVRLPDGRCLDVGTGSGILAIAAARLGMDAWGIDIDPESERAAHDNAARNGVTIRADLTPLQDVSERFELVVANLFAEVLVALADDLKRVSARDLAVAGALADRADTVVDALKPLMRLVSRRSRAMYHMRFGW